MVSLKRLTLLIWLICLAGGLRAADDPLPKEFMPVSEIRPGMVGQGRTVYQGYQIETFEAEILGVEHNALPGSDMILARLKGPRLEKHGVVAGMSGSPVYIDGRLIGAVAYGWSFAYAPYCGITPIEAMWSIWNKIGQPGPPSIQSAREGSSGLWNWQAAWQAYRDPGDEDVPVAVINSAAGEIATLASDDLSSPVDIKGFRPANPALAGIKGRLLPLWAPLYLSGAPPATEQRLRAFFARRGIEVLGAGSLAGSASEGATDETAPPIEGGSALGVPIVTGDVSMAGVGTVTYRRGDRLIAFGHPMFFKGATAAPMAAARIFGFMQSYERSFKLGEVGAVVGTLDQDRQFGVGGRFGAGPPRVPMTVQISGPAAGRPRLYHFSCWQNRDFLPMMARSVAEAAYLGSVAQSGELTAECDYRVTLSDGSVIEKRLVNSSDQLAFGPMGMNLTFDMFMLMHNPYREADVRAIDVKVNVTPGLHEDRLLSLMTEQTTLLAGDTVRLHARLRPWRGEEYTREFTVRLPNDLAPGPYIIHLADAHASQSIDRAHRPSVYAPRSYEDVVRFVQSGGFPENELRVYLFAPTTALELKSRAFGELPASVAGLIQSTAPPEDQQEAVGRLLSMNRYPSPNPISGSQSVTVNVVTHINQ